MELYWETSWTKTTRIGDRVAVMRKRFGKVEVPDNATDRQIALAVREAARWTYSTAKRGQYGYPYQFAAPPPSIPVMAWFEPFEMLVAYKRSPECIACGKCAWDNMTTYCYELAKEFYDKRETA